MLTIKFQTYDFGCVLLNVSEEKYAEFNATLVDVLKVLAGDCDGVVFPNCKCCLAGTNFWSRLMTVFTPLLVSDNNSCKVAFSNILACAKVHLERLARQESECPYTHLLRESRDYVVPVAGKFEQRAGAEPLEEFERARLTVANCSIQWQIKASALYADLLLHSDAVAQYDVTQNKVVAVPKEDIICLLIDMMGSFAHRYVHRCFDNPIPNCLPFQPDFNVSKMKTANHNTHLYSRAVLCLKESATDVKNLMSFTTDLKQVATVMMAVNKLSRRYSKYAVVQQYVERWALRYFMENENVDPFHSNYLYLVYLIAAGYCTRFVDQQTKQIGKKHLECLRQIVNFTHEFYRFLLKYPLNERSNVIGSDTLSLFYSDNKSIPEVLNKLANMF